MTEDSSTVDVILLLKLLSTVSFKKVIEHLLSVEVEWLVLHQEWSEVVEHQRLLII